jgi:hypothetical protein
MEDVLFDRVGKRYLPYLFFSSRTDMAAMTLTTTALWVYYGWDSTAFTTYGVGIHWSAIQTFCFFFWLLIVNLHIGGFNSFRQIPTAMRKDLLAFGREIFYAVKARDKLKGLRDEYKDYPSVDGGRAVAFAFFFAAAGMFGFENVWVFLYNHFQFGSWFWPIYYYEGTPFGTPLLNSIFLRNFVILIGTVFFGSVMLYAASDGERGALTQRFSIRWRFDYRWGQVCILAVGAWVFWIIMPHMGATITAKDVFASVPFTQSLFDSTSWVFPAANYFPQTDYTFYPQSAYLVSYPAKAIFGFYIDDWAVHFVNVITKYLMFMVVCYPALVRVKRN